MCKKKSENKSQLSLLKTAHFLLCAKELLHKHSTIAMAMAKVGKKTWSCGNPVLGDIEVGPGLSISNWFQQGFWVLPINFCNSIRTFAKLVPKWKRNFWIKM